MSINALDVYNQIPLIIDSARQFHEKMRANQEQGRKTLLEWNQRVPELQKKVKQVAGHMPTLRCALPVSEALTARHPLKYFPGEGILLTADGSQITPDWHGMVYYYLINVGLIQRRLDTGSGLEKSHFSKLHYGDDLYNAQNTISEDAIALIRDIQERQVLANRATEIRSTPEGKNSPIFTLTDGTLELWGSKDQAGPGFSKTLEMYIKILEQLRDMDTIMAAYVDKPRANLIVRLLEIATLDNDRLDQAAKCDAFSGVKDVDLYTVLLESGDRSAVFAIQSQSINDYKGDLSLHFFYLNVGKKETPWLVRVEIPRWVAENESRVDQLQALLLRDCGAFTETPYPYSLHRAHEEAVVTFAEKEEITARLVREFQDNHIPIDSKSYKQVQKDQPGRRRR